ncbi:MAG: hypothetical protein AN484_25480, partial [Aphanizomenon flos-aquae WA102]
GARGVCLGPAGTASTAVSAAADAVGFRRRRDARLQPVWLSANCRHRGVFSFRAIAQAGVARSVVAAGHDDSGLSHVGPRDPFSGLVASAGELLHTP